MNLTLIDRVFGGGLLAGKKTYLAALAVVITAIIQYLAGDLGLADLVTQVSEGAGIAFLRTGVSKAAAAVKDAAGSGGGT